MHRNQLNNEQVKMWFRLDPLNFRNAFPYMNVTFSRHLLSARRQVRPMSLLFKNETFRYAI